MNLLFVSNFYPPHHLGGYELLCHEVTTRLIARGHTVEVLTSTFGITSPAPNEPGIQRSLRLQGNVFHYQPQQVLRYFPDRRANLQIVRKTLAETRPDVAVIWGMWNLSWTVAAEVERIMGPRVAYYLAGAWPASPTPHEAYWTSTGRTLAGHAFLRLLQAPVGRALKYEWSPCKLRFENCAVCSRAVEEEMHKAGIGPAQYRLIYHGIDADIYREAALRRPRQSSNGRLRVVFVGSLLPQKGVHTAIEALAWLSSHAEGSHISLDILGAGHPQYEDRLQRMVNEYKLGDRITFHRPIPRAQLPDFLANYDALVLPSVWEEPQARISQEAMASGLVLVGTLTGGTKEILVDGVNGLAFARENAEELADQLTRLALDAALREELACNAWKTIQERFTAERMIDNLEHFFAETAEGHTHPTP